MKKILMAMLSGLLSINFCAISITAESNEDDSNFHIVEFNLNDKEEQTAVYYDADGTKHVLTMSADMTIVPYTEEILPYGTFTRTVSDTNDLMTMRCRIKGTSNPYTASLTSIDQGNFTSPVLQRISDYEYYIDRESTSSSTPASGRVLTQVSAVGFGTFNCEFFIKVYLDGKIEYYVRK